MSDFTDSEFHEIMIVLFFLIIVLILCVVRSIDNSVTSYLMPETGSWHFIFFVNRRPHFLASLVFRGDHGAEFWMMNMNGTDVVYRF